MKIDYSGLKSVLVLRIGKIGDLVLSSFVFSSLKKINPNIKITLITLKKNREVLEFNTYIDEIYYINKNLFSILSLLKLKFKKFDLIIDLNDNPSSTSTFLLKKLKSRHKLGFDFTRQSKYLTLKVKVPNKTQTHLIERYVKLLVESGAEIDIGEVKPEIHINPQIDNLIKYKFLEIKKHHKIISINISSGAKIRFYKSENWINIIKEITSLMPDVKFAILFLKSEKPYADQIRNSFHPDLFIHSSTTNFHEFASIIKYSDLLISPDTSAIHIASATGTSIIGLYPEPEWNFVSFAPYKVKSICLRSRTENISEINYQDVIQAYKKLMKE